MNIAFNIQQVFHPGSHSDGNAAVRRIADDCLVRLNRPIRGSGVEPAQYWLNGRLLWWILPDIYFMPGSSEEHNAHALRTLLDCLIDLNLCFLKYSPRRTIPTLYQSGVYYERTEIWDCIPGLYLLGYGDCKSLTAALIAQYRSQGIDCEPVFRFARRADGSGSLDFHILVQTENGFEDPSKVLGMGKDEVAPIRKR